MAKAEKGTIVDPDKSYLELVGTIKDDGSVVGLDSLTSQDTYTGGQALPDQTADGTAKTFTFSSPVDLIWVRVIGATGRADPFGGTPSSTQGIYIGDNEPNPITVRTSSIKVWATGGTIHVWGYRY